MLIKNEWPILEYDTSQQAVLAPDHEQLDLKLPKLAVFAFLGPQIEAYAAKHQAKRVAEFVSATKTYPIFVIKRAGKEICLVQAPVGAPAATQLLDWLIAYGVSRVISTGSCGCLVALPENTWLLPKKALRAEGTSYHYLAPSRFVELNLKALAALKRALTRQGKDYQVVTTWTTDGFYRETKELVAYRKAEGCQVVEMECAALAACAQMRGIIWGMLLYTADSLADVSHHDSRSWGELAAESALELSLAAVLELGDEDED